jgi:hypothetical protein
MSDSDLTGAKRRVGNAVLGQHGVHGVGTATAAGQVLVHLDPSQGGLPGTVLRQVQSLAKPFGLKVIEEAPPSFGGLE